jgi:hypothetical protein
VTGKSIATVFLSESSPCAQRPKKAYVIRFNPNIRQIRKNWNGAELHESGFRD